MVDVTVVFIVFFCLCLGPTVYRCCNCGSPTLGGVGCCKGSVESLDAGGTRSGIGGGGGGFGGAGDC